MFLIEHDLDVVAGVPVAVVIKAAGLFEDAGQLHAARPHVVNVGAGGFVAVFKGALLLGLAPMVASPTRTELFQIVAAINEAGVEEGRRFSPHPACGHLLPIRWGEGRDEGLDH